MMAYHQAYYGTTVPAYKMDYADNIQDEAKLSNIHTASYLLQWTKAKLFTMFKRSQKYTRKLPEHLSVRNFKP